VIGHEAVGPAGDAVRLAALGEEIAIERIVLGLDEERLAAIAALGDVMGDTGDGECRRYFCDWYHVTVIPILAPVSSHVALSTSAAAKFFRERGGL
jgi:hypothetical protein